MPLPLLYTYRRCPYAMRARMAMLLAGIEFEAFEIVLREKPANLLALSPKATVPVLCLPGGVVLEQSLDIMQWACQADARKAWWDRAQTDRNRELLSINDGIFKQALDRYKYPERDPPEGLPAEPPRDVAARALLAPLERQLTEMPFLGGDAPCAADLAIFPFVRQFAAVDPGWFAQLPFVRLQSWLARWLASPLFTTCMHKLPANQAQRFPPWSGTLFNDGVGA